MALTIKPPVQVPALEMSASPYIGTKLWTEGLDLMHHWMAGYFEVGDEFPDFTFAQTLKVHRAIADIWLGGLLKVGHIISHEFRVGRNNEVYAPGFVVTPTLKKVKDVNLKVGDLVNYDPWVDRDLDNELPDAKYADFYIDKYYDVFVNEHYIALNTLRRRPDGKVFQPLDLTEHPRFASIIETKKFKNSPPPIEWRKLIDELACS